MPPLTEPVPARPLIDGFQRRISYLRLSVIDRCDLRCRYCMPERQVFLPRAEVLTLEELHRLAQESLDEVVRRCLTHTMELLRENGLPVVADTRGAWEFYVKTAGDE